MRPYFNFIQSSRIEEGDDKDHIVMANGTAGRWGVRFGRWWFFPYPVFEIGNGFTKHVQMKWLCYLIEIGLI